jgi:hypothetical protein
MGGDMSHFIKTMQELRNNLGLTCWGDNDAPQLIAAAELALRERLTVLSTMPEYVHMIWSWVEKTRLEIYGRIQEDPQKQSQEDYGERLSAKISAIFKSGAVGAQVLIDKGHLDFLVSALYPVKDDLFFGRRLFLGLALNKIDPFDWEDIFYRANKIGASGLMFEKGAPDKKKKEADDTVGRLYGLFDFVGSGYAGQLQFSGFNIAEIEFAWRLCGKMRPELLSRLVFFLDRAFFKAD